MDYSCFDVENFDEYLVILRKKNLDKVVTKNVNKKRWKEREDKCGRKTTIEWIEYKVTNKCVRAWFLALWFTIQ